MSALTEFEKAQLVQQVACNGNRAVIVAEEMITCAILGVFQACDTHRLDPKHAARLLLDHVAEQERILLSMTPPVPITPPTKGRII